MTGRILPDLTQPAQPTIAELLARIAQLESEKRANSGRLTMKVTDKGGLSVYGLGRFPVSLYRSQWERLLDHADAIRAFISANESTLARKDP